MNLRYLPVEENFWRTAASGNSKLPASPTNSAHMASSYDGHYHQRKRAMQHMTYAR